MDYNQNPYNNQGGNQPAFNQNPYNNNPNGFTPSMSGNSSGGNKYRKKIKIRRIIFLACVAITVILFVISNAKNSNAPLMQADAYSSNSKIGDYVTVDVIGFVDGYESYRENTETGAQTTKAYYLIALDSNQNTFVLKCNKNFFDEKLANLNKNDETIKLYADVKSIESEVKTKIDSEYQDGAFTNELEVVETPRKETNSAGGVFGLFVMLTFVMVLLNLIFNGKDKKTARILDDYGDVDAIYNQVASSPVFSDECLVTDGRYIISHNKKAICTCAEVLNMCVYVHKTNFITDMVAISINNRYGEQLLFPYAKNKKDELAGKLVKIFPLCPNSTLGHTAESMQYVREHKIARRK